MLQRRPELGGKAPVRDEYEADHQTPRRRVSLAPHERAPIMTIRSPYARAVLGLWASCCIAKFAPFPAPGRNAMFRPAG
jgi:hypothetical protein